MKHNMILVLLGIILHPFYLCAKVRLPALFADHMVLQRDTLVNLSGMSAANTEVKVTTSWDMKTYAVKADQLGRWDTKLATGKAGGPYEIIIDDGDTLQLRDVLLGEVWVCSGQSNMEMAVKGWRRNQPVLNALEGLLAAKNESLRLFKLDKVASDTIVTDSNGKWMPSSVESVYDFSAIGFYYAKLLQEQLGVPIGIIQAALGGTPIEAWMSKNSLLRFTPEISQASLDELKGKYGHASLYFNGIIGPLLNFTIKGVIWYQGEANRFRPYNYGDLMQEMVRDWRERWDQGCFPFYFVQLSPYRYTDGRPNYPERVAYMRDIQRELQYQIPNSGMVVTIDLGDSTTIHPPNKETVAKRLALWALANTYGRNGLPHRSPELESHEVIDDVIFLTFRYAENGLTTFGRPITGFEIAGQDWKFHPATATITVEGITVHSEFVKQPVAVRYAYTDWVSGCLYSCDGLPLSSFRTDHWDIP